jgi:hypothetical protein
MQASTSGFFVHVSHDPSNGTDLRVDAAEKFLAELDSALAEVKRAHEDAVAAGHPYGEAQAPAPESDDDHQKRVEAGKKAAETRKANAKAEEKKLAAKNPKAKS